MQTQPPVVKFEVGKTYYTSSACDHNCIYTVKVLSRTEKTLRALVDGRDVKTLRPSIYRNAEQVQRAGHNISSAAEQMTRAASNMQDAVFQAGRLLERFEQACANLVEALEKKAGPG